MSRFHVLRILKTSTRPPIADSCVIAQLRNYPRSAESRTILHAVEVFDSVTREAFANIEERLEEKTATREVAEDLEHEEM